MTALLQAAPSPEPEFESLTLAEAIERSKGRRPFLVDNLICSTLTLIYGEPLSGKSTLAALLMASCMTGEPFLGKPLQHPITKIALVTTEVDGPEEYGRRLSELGVDPDGDCLRIYPVESLSAEQWGRLAQVIGPDDRTLVVVDNLTQVLPDGGSINDDETIRVVFRGLRKFTARGACAVLVGHMSEKSGQHGKSSKPLGSTSISAGSRWGVRVVRKGGDVIQLACEGNGDRGASFTIERGDKETEFRDVTEIDGTQLASHRRDRNAATARRLAAMADWAVANVPAGTSQAEMAARLVAEYPGELSKAKDPARQVAKQLSQGMKIGGFLKRHDDGRWSRVHGTPE